MHNCCATGNRCDRARRSCARCQPGICNLSFTAVGKSKAANGVDDVAVAVVVCGRSVDIDRGDTKLRETVDFSCLADAVAALVHPDLELRVNGIARIYHTLAAGIELGQIRKATNHFGAVVNLAIAVLV